MNTRTILMSALASLAISAQAQNPYMPMWEYIPDGEPHVFEDPDRPGSYRVYVYGSHDIFVTSYCGNNQVAWSAPVENLQDWRYDGIIFRSTTGADGRNLHDNGDGDLLYAPDVTVKTDSKGKKTYYLYPNNQNGPRRSMVASSDRPDGPFKAINWDPENPESTIGCMGFDPSVLIDDDGRVYGYWGGSTSSAAELDPATMSTVKPGTSIVENMIPGFKQDTVFRFYEASSMRKIKDKYVFLYSRMTREGEFGLPQSNYNLAYAYSDSPLGPFTYGGTVIDGRARETGSDGKVTTTAYPNGNTHGGLCEIGGRWWIFYHRQTGTDEFSRQAMVAPVNIQIEEGPKGKVTISEAEFNSEGFRTEGLDPLQRSAAGWACYLVNPDPVQEKWPNYPFTGSYIRATRFNPESCEGPFNLKIPYCPVVNNTSGSTVGYRYFNFDRTRGMRHIDIVMRMVPLGVKGSIVIFVADTEIGRLELDGTEKAELSEFRVNTDTLARIKGKQPLYFRFRSDTPHASLCDLYDFIFMERR